MGPRIMLGVIAVAALLLGGCPNGIYGSKKTVIIEYNGQKIPQPHLIPLVANGTHFGQIPVGSYEEHTFKVTNQKPQAVTFVASPTVWIEGVASDDFVLTSALPDTLAVDASAEFTIQFHPSALGMRAAIVLIPYRAEDLTPGSLQLTLMGEGLTAIPVPGEVEVRNPSGIVIQNADDGPSSGKETDFGNLDPGLGETVTRTFTIHNVATSGDITLLTSPTIYIVGNDADQFTLGGLPADGAVILPGGHVSFTITFVPDILGLMEATIVIVNDDDDEGFYFFNIQGTGASTT